VLSISPGSLVPFKPTASIASGGCAGRVVVHPTATSASRSRRPSSKHFVFCENIVQLFGLKHLSLLACQCQSFSTPHKRHAKEMDWVLSALSVPFLFRKRKRGKTQPYILDFRLVCKLHSDDLQICSLSMVEINFSITSQASSKLVSERLDIACPCPRPRPRFFHSPLPPYVVV